MITAFTSQKAHACLRSLNQSKTLDELTKEKFDQYLMQIYLQMTLKLMLQPHEENKAVIVKMRQLQLKKRLRRHRLPRRSQEFQKVIESLDRKLERRRSDRAKVMCLEVMVGSDSQREVSSNRPEWALELFPS